VLGWIVRVEGPGIRDLRALRIHNINALLGPEPDCVAEAGFQDLCFQHNDTFEPDMT
jgi:hypothetical protein